VPLISTSGEVNGSDVIFDQSAIKGASRGSGIIAYFDYEKGASDTTINVALAFNDASIDSNFYNHLGPAIIDDFNLPTVTGKYRVKLPITLNEDIIKLTIDAGLVDGILNIEFQTDNPFIIGPYRQPYVPPVVYEYTDFNPTPNDPRNENSSQTYANSNLAVDGDGDTYAAFVYSQQDDLHLTTNECDGTDLGPITKVEVRFRHFGYGDHSFWPYFNGAVNGDESARFPTASGPQAWTNWDDLTDHTNSPGSGNWTWTDIQELEMRIHCYSGGAPHRIYLAELRVTHD
jgi:hypothetical protein